MSSYTPPLEVNQLRVSNAELSKLQDLITEHGPQKGCETFIGSPVQDFSLMKDRAHRYYVDGPVYRGDTSLLARAWLSGYAAVFHKEHGIRMELTFEIDSLVIS